MCYHFILKQLKCPTSGDIKDLQTYAYLHRQKVGHYTVDCEELRLCSKTQISPQCCCLVIYTAIQEHFIQNSKELQLTASKWLQDRSYSWPTGKEVQQTFNKNQWCV